ncbi:hypothetical protein TorRG33x02_353130, partial [Trema orientale]
MSHSDSRQVNAERRQRDVTCGFWDMMKQRNRWFRLRQSSMIMEDVDGKSSRWLTAMDSCFWFWQNCGGNRMNMYRSAMV